MSSEGLAGALVEIEGKVTELLKEIRRLKSRALTLEEENRRLRALLTAETDGEDASGGLIHLYRQGFHICPPNFARVRGQEDCLFCLSFLERRGK